MTLPSGVTEANCTAQSRPAAHITWNVGGDNRTLGPPISSEYDQGDGTTVVTSTLLFQSGLLSDLLVKCIVQHRGLEKPVTVSLYTDSKDTRKQPQLVARLYETLSYFLFSCAEKQSCCFARVCILDYFSLW